MASVFSFFFPGRKKQYVFNVTGFQNSIKAKFVTLNDIPGLIMNYLLVHIILKAKLMFIIIIFHQNITFLPLSLQQDNFHNPSIQWSKYCIYRPMFGTVFVNYQHGLIKDFHFSQCVRSRTFILTAMRTPATELPFFSIFISLWSLLNSSV